MWSACNGSTGRAPRDCPTASSEPSKARGRESAMSTYLTCAESAKLLRRALARSFPGIKFSVRSSTYSGGASIRVGWTDGPRRQAVERIAGQFAGATFDGMTDSMHYHTTTLDGRDVRLGSDFVFCNREVSDYDAKVATADAYIRQHCRLEGSEPHPRFGNQWVSDLARGMAYDWTDGAESAFRRVVLRESD